MDESGVHIRHRIGGWGGNLSPTGAAVRTALDFESSLVAGVVRPVQGDLGGGIRRGGQACWRDGMGRARWGVHAAREHDVVPGVATDACEVVFADGGLKQPEGDGQCEILQRGDTG